MRNHYDIVVTFNKNNSWMHFSITFVTLGCITYFNVILFYLHITYMYVTFCHVFKTAVNLAHKLFIHNVIRYNFFISFSLHKLDIGCFGLNQPY